MLAKELFATLLGLPAGWQIRDIEVSPTQPRIDIHVERAPSALDRLLRRRQETVEHRWQTQPVAGRSCFLHLHVPGGETLPNEPWTGDGGRPFTREFAQRLRVVGTALRTGDERTVYEQTLRVSVTDLRRQDIFGGGAAAPPSMPMPPPHGASAPAPAAVAPVAPAAVLPAAMASADDAPLPDGAHPLWRRLALGEVGIDIRSLPLKLLLTRIRMQVKQDPRMLADASAELHRFFIDRARILGHEVAQIGRLKERNT
jgi:hypothetical protein